jgi:FKBP-type peptidyl-prolyl cis-trans isomerase 2
MGHLRGGMSNSDLKEVGEMLEETEAALIVVGEATIERAVEEAIKRTKNEMKKEVRVEARDIERAIASA